MADKHPVRIKQIGPDMYTFVLVEAVTLKLGKILGKLSNDAAPGPTRLRNNHVNMWMGAFAPDTTDEAIEHLEDLITDMANDKLPPWFMHAMHGTQLLAIIKTEGSEDSVGDHRSVVIPNIIIKVTDKAILQECQEEYTRELLPH